MNSGDDTRTGHGGGHGEVCRCLLDYKCGDDVAQQRQKDHSIRCDGKRPQTPQEWSDVGQLKERGAQRRVSVNRSVAGVQLSARSHYCGNTLDLDSPTPSTAASTAHRCTSISMHTHHHLHHHWQRTCHTSSAATTTTKTQLRASFHTIKHSSTPTSHCHTRRSAASVASRRVASHHVEAP